MSIQLNDYELVKLYTGGDESALAVLLERHKRKIFSSIIMVVKDHQLAEDVFQDTFFKVILTLKKGQYSEEGKFLPWVLRIARNLIIDHFRRAKKMPPVPVYVNEEGEEISVFNQLSSPDEPLPGDTAQEFKKSIRRQQAAAMAPSPSKAHLLIHRFRAGAQRPAGLSRVLGPFGQQAPKGQAHLQPAVFLALQQHGLPGAHLLTRGVIGLQARGPGALEMGQQLPKAGGEGIPVAHGAAHRMTLGLARQPFGSPNPGAIREREERL
ncbi:MAG: sigma-70 family RNA polymerase sigma factor [Proteobacteria bacterium]|nr:sigma-70 family RNA polymerase sigma factor [Pseudomonadota bacterium]